MSKITKKVRRTYLEDQGYKCDTCGEFMMCDTITLGFGFGCDKDMQPDEHYCSYKCLGLAYEKYVRKGKKIPHDRLVKLGTEIVERDKFLLDALKDEIDFSPRSTKQDELM